MCDPNTQDPNVPLYENYSTTTQCCKHKVRVVQHESIPYDLLVNAAKSSTTHELERNTHSASRSKIISAMEASKRGGIFVSDTHCFFDGSNPKNPHPKALGIEGDNWVGEDKIWLAEMLAAFKRGTPPAAAVICGCCSGDLLPGLVKCGGASVAFGINAPNVSVPAFISAENNTAVAQAVSAALVSGQSIRVAASAGRAAINPKETHYVELEVVFECADDVDPSLSLKANDLL